VYIFILLLFFCFVLPSGVIKNDYSTCLNSAECPVDSARLYDDNDHDL